MYIYSFGPSILYLIYVSLKVRGLDLRNHFNYVNMKKKKLSYTKYGKKLSCFFLKKSLLGKIVEIFVKNNYKNNLVVYKKYDRTSFAFWSAKTELNGYFIS